MRLILSPTAQPVAATAEPFWKRGEWPAIWLAGEPGVSLFRCAFTWTGGALTLHVSADQRYRLFLDGEPLGQGPERGDVDHWRFESYRCELPAGEHQLVARVWWLADAPLAQATLKPAFLCLGEGSAQALINTGIAAWERRADPAWATLDKRMAWGTGAKCRVTVDAAMLAGPQGGGDGWTTAPLLGPAARGETGYLHHRGTWHLEPALLPAQQETRVLAGVVRRGAPQLAAALVGSTVTLAAGTSLSAIVDLEYYRCAYAEVTASGTGMVRIAWAEALFTGDSGEGKTNRAAVDGLRFDGVADEFHFTGPQGTISPLWWQAGRFLEITVTAGTSPLHLHGLAWRETGYPLQVEAEFSSSDARLDRCLPLLERVLRRCSHETFMDCPYYEQLQYCGDTRLECLATRALSRDHRLVEKALITFAWSQRHDGLLSSRYPASDWQNIPTFSLMWIGMLHDTLTYGDPALVRAQLGTMRAILERYRAQLRDDDQLGWIAGWNFIDWVPTWPNGEAPGDREGSAITTWLLAYALTLAAEIETWAGEDQLAARNRALAQRLAGGCESAWDDHYGLYRDSRAATSFSEHPQVLALLSGLLPPARTERLLASLENDPRLVRTTVYFSHYLFEVAARFQRPNLLFRRLEYWQSLPEQGFTTVPEQPEPSRSDCHAWGAHPWYHLLASVLGIRPARPGFAAVRITPMVGPLTHVNGVWPHALGDIRVTITGDHGSVAVPAGLPTTLVLAGREIAVNGSYNW